jgi:hypothetical protein
MRAQQLHVGLTAPGWVRVRMGRTLCATLYARRGDTWRVLFHQQTSV